VATTKGYPTVHGISVKVTTSGLTAIELHGGASASGDGFEAQSLALNLTGGARLTLSGAVTDLEVEASGGAVLELGRLKLTTARVKLSRGGDDVGELLTHGHGVGRSRGQPRPAPSDRRCRDLRWCRRPRVVANCRRSLCSTGYIGPYDRSAGVGSGRPRRAMGWPQPDQ
ncbi:MAG TPA: DUF2807 domain-containing protein, partial [Intrasporangium sp.]|nr:DUF2807 domain-containing protein [Intrasporangium sp.]